MGQPRPEEQVLPVAVDEADAFGRSFGKAWTAWRQSLTPAPLPPQRAARGNDNPELKGEAAQATQRAIEEGRATPRPAATPAAPQEKTTCLRTAREPESSDPPSSKESTEEEELTPGELSSLARMAADDRETLERKRLQRLTLATKPRT